MSLPGPTHDRVVTGTAGTRGVASGRVDQVAVVVGRDVAPLGGGDKSVELAFEDNLVVVGVNVLDLACFHAEVDVDR